MTQERIDVMSLPAAREWLVAHPDSPAQALFMAVQSGGLILAAAFGHLFWPELIEIGGCVLIRDHYRPQSFEHWWDHFSGDVPEVEKMINHLDFEDLYYAAGNSLQENIAERLLTELAGIVAKTWAAALRDSFPGRDFTVGLFPGDNYDHPAVWFHSAVQKV